MEAPPLQIILAGVERAVRLSQDERVLSRLPVEPHLEEHLLERGRHRAARRELEHQAKALGGALRRDARLDFRLQLDLQAQPTRPQPRDADASQERVVRRHLAGQLVERRPGRHRVLQLEHQALAQRQQAEANRAVGIEHDAHLIARHLNIGAEHLRCPGGARRLREHECSASQCAPANQRPSTFSSVSTSPPSVRALRRREAPAGALPLKRHSRPCPGST